MYFNKIRNKKNTKYLMNINNIETGISIFIVSGADPVVNLKEGDVFDIV